MLIVLQLVLISRILLTRRQDLTHLCRDVGLGAQVDEASRERGRRFKVLHLVKETDGGTQGKHEMHWL